MLSRAVRLLFSATAATAFALSVQADEYQWNGKTSYDITDPSNWTPEGAPGSGDAVVFGVGGDWSANTSSDALVGSIQTLAPGHFVLNDHTLYTTTVQIANDLLLKDGAVVAGIVKINAGTVNFGYGGSSDLALTGNISDFLWIGSDGSSPNTGNVWLTLNTGSSLHIGTNGEDHSLVIGEGYTSGSFNVDGPGAVLTVDGKMVIGSGNSGTLSTSGGGRIVAQDIIISDSPAAYGTLTLESVGATEPRTEPTLQAAQVTVGRGGYGNAYFGSGEAVTITSLILGDMEGSTGYLDMASNLLVTDSLIVGNNGSGNLFVYDGGVLELGYAHERPDLQLGKGLNAYGNLTVNGVGSVANVGSIHIGVDGSANVSVSNHGVLNTEGDVFFGSNYSNASVMGDGAVWQVTGNVTTSTNSYITVGGMGTLKVAGDMTILSASSIEVSSLGTVQVDGSLQNEGSIYANGAVTLAASLTNNGSLSVSPYSYYHDYEGVSERGKIQAMGSGGMFEVNGPLTITGDYTQTINGSLNLGVYEMNYEQLVGQLIIEGDASFAGSLCVEFYTYSQFAWYSQPLIEVFGDVTGDFDWVCFSGLPEGWTYKTWWDQGTFYAEVVPEPSTWALMGLGLGGVVWMARRRRTA